MNTSNLISNPTAHQAINSQANLTKTPQKPDEREVFDQFVGQTFFGQMLKALRSSVGEPAYFHGGQAEEMFRNRLDEIMAEDLSKTHAKEFTGPMYKQFVSNMRAQK